jgi:hypothetical protein
MNTRIVTITDAASGKPVGNKYVVRAFFPDTQKYRVWGEVVRTTGRKRLHGEDFLVDRAHVTCEERTVDVPLHNELLAQGVDALRASGVHVARTRYGNYITRRAG